MDGGLAVIATPVDFLVPHGLISNGRQGIASVGDLFVSISTLLPAARRHRRPGTTPPLPATVFRRISEGPIIDALGCRAICYRWPKAYAIIRTEASRDLLERSMDRYEREGTFALTDWVPWPWLRSGGFPNKN
jgi:hypothetical protein